MFDLIGIRRERQDAHGPGGYYTEKVEVEYIVATFDSKKDAFTYIKKSKLMNQPIPIDYSTWDKMPFKKESLLCHLGRATVRKSIYKPPPHNPTLCVLQMPKGKSFKCPCCGIGKMSVEVITDHHTKIGGIPVLIKDAIIAKCNHCGETSVHAKELERWEAICRQNSK